MPISLGIDQDFFEKSDIHLHVPAGAIPKDGPSAGVTMAASLASLLSGRPMRSDVAMTGEITLRGKVLPVGGIKEKVLAARRAGIKTVILPRRNERDLEDIAPEVLAEMTTIFVDTVDQVLDNVLTKGKASLRLPASTECLKKPSNRLQQPNHADRGRDVELVSARRNR